MNNACRLEMPQRGISNLQAFGSNFQLSKVALFLVTYAAVYQEW
jgi:hypothetical protein